MVRGWLRYNLPQNQDFSTVSHFAGVTTSSLPDKCSVDTIIRLDNSHLMTVIEERHGERGQPHAIQTPLGWTASNGHFQLGATDLSTRRVVVSQTDDEKDLKILKLQETIRDLAVENETIQASINDGKARLMVEGNIKVCKNRYQIPVPLKENVTSIPDNFDLAAKRLGFLRKRMLKDPEPTSKVEQSIQELKTTEQ